MSRLLRQCPSCVSPVPLIRGYGFFVLLPLSACTLYPVPCTLV